QFVEAARALATAVSQTHSDIQTQINEAFLRLTGRGPDSVELDLLSELYKDQRRLFEESEQQDAKTFVQLGESPPDGNVVPSHLAALTVTCQAILNLDATIFER
ncbi:MAG: hypothetical protein WD229_00050, partial [Pirellulales bacterium]